MKPLSDREKAIFASVVQDDATRAKMAALADDMRAKAIEQRQHAEQLEQWALDARETLAAIESRMQFFDALLSEIAA